MKHLIQLKKYLDSNAYRKNKKSNSSLIGSYGWHVKCEICSI